MSNSKIINLKYDRLNNIMKSFSAKYINIDSIDLSNTKKLDLTYCIGSVSYAKKVKNLSIRTSVLMTDDIDIPMKQLKINTDKIIFNKPLNNSITSLTLINSTINDLTPIINLSSLLKLELENVQLCNINGISAFNSLTSLNIPRNPINDISQLININSLTELNINNTPIKNDLELCDFPDYTNRFSKTVPPKIIKLISDFINKPLVEELKKVETSRVKRSVCGIQFP